MGFERHHAIVVTTYDPKAEPAAAKARELGCTVLGPSEEVINGMRTVVVCPDGSKEGWSDSAIGDERRAAFKTWLRTSGYPWVEVAFGHDDGRAWVEDSQWGLSTSRTKAVFVITCNDSVMQVVEGSADQADKVRDELREAYFQRNRWTFGQNEERQREAFMLRCHWAARSTPLTEFT